METVFKDIFCIRMENTPTFGGLSNILSSDYSQLLPILLQMEMKADPSRSVGRVYTNIRNAMP